MSQRTRASSIHLSLTCGLDELVPCAITSGDELLFLHRGKGVGSSGRGGLDASRRGRGEGSVTVIWELINCLSIIEMDNI